MRDRSIRRRRSRRLDLPVSADRWWVDKVRERSRLAAAIHALLNYQAIRSRQLPSTYDKRPNRLTIQFRFFVARFTGLGLPAIEAARQQNN
jgi:hypothetical protein